MKLDIVFEGKMFEKLNRELEREVSGGDHVLCPVSARLREVFACNAAIRQTENETYGDMIIDDIHYVMSWDISGCTVKYYYEQFWDVRTLEISSFDETALGEIAQAFVRYFNAPLDWSIRRTENECAVVIIER